MKAEKKISTTDQVNWNKYMAGISIDCVIFGYNKGELKILLLEYKKTGLFALPGGFIKKNESLNSAALHTLNKRTGLTNIFLNQFQTFGGLERHDPGPMKKLMESNNTLLPDDHWLYQRFITVGYYALVDYKKAVPVPDMFSDSCGWHDMSSLPELILDHNKIVQKAFQQLKDNIDHKAVGLNLLDKTFTMAELKKLYETILEEKLHRTGFHRKMINSGRLKRLGKKKTGKAHRSPFLYRFKSA